MKRSPLFFIFLCLYFSGVVFAQPTLPDPDDWAYFEVIPVLQGEQLLVTAAELEDAHVQLWLMRDGIWGLHYTVSQDLDAGAMLKIDILLDGRLIIAADRELVFRF